MFYLTGTAASSALDLIAALQQTLGAINSNGAQPAATGFDPAAGATSAASSAPTDANGPPSLLAPSTLDALLAVQGQGQTPLVNGDAFSQQLFSLLDANGDGTISKSEFDAAFGQNGSTTQADQILARLDANGDGSISAAELTNAIEGGSQSAGTPQVHHHHHHHGGFGGFAALANAGLGGVSGSGDAGGASDPLAALGGTSQSVTNADGSTTTTITYADGSQVSMTTPAAKGSATGGSANNVIERLIARQAQMLASATAGQSLAVSA